MVENQQGLENHIDAVLTFNTKSVSPEIRERMLFGRRELAETLFKNLSKSVNNKNSIQVQIIGKRGMGKSHLLAYLYDRMQPFLKEDKCKIAYLSEEEYGVASYLDILVRIIQSFKRWHPETEEFFETRLDKLREGNQESQESLAEQIVIEYSEDKPLYIFLENLDDIFEAIKIEGQNLLRSFLTRNANVSMFCTSQALSIDVEKENKPFFGFFETIYLKQLTFEESLDLVKELALIEKNEKVTEFLKGKGTGYVAAINKLMKGNPRLLVRFYEFLKADTMSNLSVIFMKTINELKPYFESFIRPLPALEQKILYYLAFQRIPKSSADIAKDNFIKKTSLSKKLSELQRRHLIDSSDNPVSKRDKLYEIADPMLRMALATGENKDGVSGMMLDFAAICFSIPELKKQMNDYTRNSIERKLRELIIDRKAKILHLYFDSNEIYNEVSKCIDGAYFVEGESFLNSIPESGRDLRYFDSRIKLYVSQNMHDKLVSFMEDCGDRILHKGLYQFILGGAYFSLANYNKALEWLLKSEKNEYKDSLIYEMIGLSYHRIQDFSNAIIYLEKADENSFIYFGLSDSYLNLRNYKKSLDNIFHFYNDKSNVVDKKKALDGYPFVFLEEILENKDLGIEEIDDLIAYLSLFEKNELRNNLIGWLDHFNVYILKKNLQTNLDQPKEVRELIKQIKN